MVNIKDFLFENLEKDGFRGLALNGVKQARNYSIKKPIGCIIVKITFQLEFYCSILHLKD